MMNFKTQRLEVKSLSAQDREAVIDLLTDDQVKQFYMVPDFSSREEAMPLFERLRQLSVGEDRLVAGIFLDGQCIGIMNEVETKDKRIELGYALLPRYHNLGYCTEALNGAIDYLFCLGFEEVIAGAFEENEASFRVMVKSGMEKLQYQDEIEYRGKVHRCVYYAIRKRES
jgi:RimJ/RimL family protein N-acetyltransferase